MEEQLFRVEASTAYATQAVSLGDVGLRERRELLWSGFARPRCTFRGRFQEGFVGGSDGVGLDPVGLGVCDEVAGVGDLLEEQLLVFQGPEGPFS